MRFYGFFNFRFDFDQIVHQRKVYGILELFGDFGGFMEVMLLAGAFLMSPVSAHMFLIKAL